MSSSCVAKHRFASVCNIQIMGLFLEICGKGLIVYIFISAIAGIILNSELFNFFQFNFRRDSEYRLENSSILLGSEYKRENYISQAAGNNSFLLRWNERVVVMLSYAEFIEMKPANVRNYAFVRRVTEIKRTSVNFSFAESFACIQQRIRLCSVVIFIFSSRRIKGVVNW